MLNRRIHILFDEALANQVTQRAKKDNLSIGEFIRSAVEDKLKQEELRKKKEDAFTHIQAFREKYGKKLAKGEDSTTLINRLREERTQYLLTLADSNKK